jgi:hypothetical protein
MVAWSPVANATAYRIYRGTETEQGVLRAIVSKADASRFSTEYLSALDPDPGARYWVEAVLADGSISKPGLITDLRISAMGLAGPVLPPVPNLTVTMGGTTTVNTLEGQVRGNTLTWRWDQLNAPVPESFFYFATIQTAAATNGPINSLGVPLTFRSETLKTGRQAPYAIMLQASAAGPPFSISFPSGTMVKFCISQMPIESLVKSGRYTYSWNVPISCIESALPPP